jgi:hypothetical protein
LRRLGALAADYRGARSCLPARLARRSVLGRLPDHRNARANTDGRELVLTRPRRHTEPELEFNPLIDKLRLERLNRSTAAPTAAENHS